MNDSNNNNNIMIYNHEQLKGLSSCSTPKNLQELTIYGLEDEWIEGFDDFNKTASKMVIF